MAKPELQFAMHGDVPDSFQQELKQQLEECYRRLPTSGLEVVQVCLLDTVKRLGKHLAAEHAELGIAGPMGTEFLALHDAWHGLPRITICHERLAEVPHLVSLGAQPTETLALHSPTDGEAVHRSCTDPTGQGYVEFSAAGRAGQAMGANPADSHRPGR